MEKFITSFSTRSSILKAKFVKYVLFLSLIIFLTAFNFRDVMVGSWNPQYIYNTNGQSIRDMAFADSLTGYSIMRSNTSGEGTILKTTNGGNNWFYSYHTFDSSIFTNIIVFNKDSVLVCNAYKLFKTTNGGINWAFINVPYILETYYIYAFNFDTIWAGNGTGFHKPQLYLTTNGGLNWTKKYEILIGGGQFDGVYFYNRRIGYCWIAGSSTSGEIYKTTNGGENWFWLVDENYTRKMQFLDSLTGWKCGNTDYLMKKTTDGGYTWVTQIIPSGGLISSSRVYDFNIINKDTIWGCGGQYYIAPITSRKGILWKTTNGGENWGYQLPDTNTMKYDRYYKIFFINKYNGWAYNIGSTSINFGPGGVHTTTGGLDSTVYVGIKENNLNIAKGFILYQNYPNPFNQCTIINVQLPISKQIKINIYDIAGKLITTLVNKKENSGYHNYKFDGGNLSSGIYFYRIQVEDLGSAVADGKGFTAVKKMLMIK